MKGSQVCKVCKQAVRISDENVIMCSPVGWRHKGCD